MEDQAPLYCLALLGTVPGGQAEELKQEIAVRLKGLGLELGKDVSLFEGDLVHFHPAIDRCSAALCFSMKGGGAPHNDAAVGQLIKCRVPLIPVATCKDNFAAEFPGKLGGLNGLEMKGGLGRLAMALLEGASLLPKQRRVFLSYRRVESTNAALQLYAALSARQYDVFLDTHDILPGEHFQEVLWHRLCDSDVMIYLDTAEYFDSRWTKQEFAKATLRGLCVLRVGWPGVKSKAEQTACGEVRLTKKSLNAFDQLVDAELNEVMDMVEMLRTKSVAQRYSRLVSKLRNSLEDGKGEIVGYSVRRSVIVKIAGKRIVAYPEMGVPTSSALHEATLDFHMLPVAVVYNQAGIKDRKWRAHMDWLNDSVTDQVRLISTEDAGSEFIEWPESHNVA
ncbi:MULTISPECIES: toll/interleukin-1 receptor domain-containing protein [Pseudomonas syringae group]|uniref:toll/interleukin-1 receptor domain-containing protein n=1 Tax=Pseudomonas syringae group TaxID=136849 RepID=UPI0013037491|nr:MULTISPECIES: toll/interleukin-1 receptor domain-containing protein [Pseudomonas syringae group]MCF5199888.1 TIR domain-containing protein [Pseudomonas syringae]MCF5209309.1 TIR domain-containing protein [Pseudomonas syringae]MCF5214946.1 TIR domain-containing protein [Pseudomonas syringae]MCF5218372.1 TIR domain-containing protein [Pseudomonas syringae]MCF5268003.1 TIR domain-containing protein [Pseudomonas syringae]